MAGGWHQFQAPIGGKNARFAMRCAEGVPQHLEMLQPAALEGLHQQLCVINLLLKEPGGWEVVKLQHQGDIGAVIEAAEARRAELYGEVAA